MDKSGPVGQAWLLSSAKLIIADRFMSGGLNNGSLLFPRATYYAEKDCPLRNFAATSHFWLQKENISEENWSPFNYQKHTLDRPLGYKKFRQVI